MGYHKLQEGRMSQRAFGLRLMFTVLALAALSAVMAVACAGEESAAQAAPQQPVEAAPAAPAAPATGAAPAAQAAAAPAAPQQPAAAAPADPAMAAAEAAPAMAGATAAPEAVARVAPEIVALAGVGVPPQVQAVLDELGLDLGQPGAYDGTPKVGGTIRVRGLEPKTFDIHQYFSYRLRLTNGYTHLRLLRWDQGPGKSPTSYIPVPSVAESWDVQDGGKTVVFNLRKGVKWHDKAPVNGREVIASDFVFTFDRIQRIEAATRQREYLGKSESWEAPDDYTFIVHNETPVAAFLVSMAQAGLEVHAPEVEEACGDYGIPECSNIGTGPWMFNNYNPGVSTSMVRHPDYWEQPFPYIGEVVQLFFGDERAQDAAFRTGKVDLIGVETCAISGERFRALSTSNPELLYPSFADGLNKRGIWMKGDKPPFNDVRVRRAVAVSLDRVGWVRGPLGGFGLPFGGNLAYGTEYWLPDDGYGEASQWLEYDPDRAVALLAEAGYGPGDIKATLASTADYGERFASEAEVSAGFMNAIGIDTSLVMSDYDSFVPVWRDGNYEHAAYNWSQTGTIPEEWLYNPFHSSRRGTTHLGIVDPGLDALLDALSEEFDPVERTKLTQQAATRVIDQAYNPLGAYWIYFYGQNPRIVNYTYHDWMDNGHAMSYAWIEG